MTPSGKSTVPVASPILIEYSEAIGQVGTQKVRAPVVEALSLIMIARGADRIILPAPGSREQDRIAAAIADLPASRRRAAKLVDEDGSLLRRIRWYLEPLRHQAAKWPEDAFVGFAESFLYQAALAHAEKASVLTDAVNVVREFLPIIDPNSFRDEALFRLADIFSLVTSYEPAMADEGAAATHYEAATIGTTVDDVIHSAEFNALASTAGGLGLATRPRVALKEFGRRLRALIARKEAKQMLALARTAADLSGAGQAAEATERVFGALEIGKGQTEFRPPFFGLGSASLGLYRAALHNRYPEAGPPSGTIMVFESFRGGRTGVSWLNEGEEDKLAMEAAKAGESRAAKASEAKAAYQRFLR